MAARSHGGGSVHRHRARMNGSLTAHHDELLSRLERLEMSWLSWGRVDGSITEAEALRIAAEVGGRADRGDELINDLLDASLLLDVGRAERLVRTRFAESVRLLVRNRQLLHARPWRTAAQLVNDFRVLAQSASVPTTRLDLRATGRVSRHRPSARGWRAPGARGHAQIGRRNADAFAIPVRRDASHPRELGDLSPVRDHHQRRNGQRQDQGVLLTRCSPQSPRRPMATLWARVLAIYPRNELLKDQLAEALAQVELVAANGGPTLAVGALFGPTMANARAVAEDARRDHRGWVETESGFACRYLRCPRGCSQDLIWGREDWQRDEEVVACRQCGWRSRPAQVVLTRERLRAGARPRACSRRRRC